MLLGDLVFRLEHTRNDGWELGEQCFVFFKTKYLVDQFARFFGSLAGFHANNVFEVGLFDGGSMAFWFECFKPEKHVGIDINQRSDSDYFSRYVTFRKLENRLKTYWGTDQGDKRAVRKVIQREFSGPVDLVLDDGSHMYGLTKATFEAAFPLLRPGGLYVIEDWAWAHWKEFQGAEHPWAKETPLTKLIVELMEAAGTSSEVVAGLNVYQGFVVVERGGAVLNQRGRFLLSEHISRRPER
jgi:hypothetical protein